MVMAPMAMMWIGVAVTAVAAISQAAAQRDAAKTNAAIAERNAGIAREQAMADAESQQRLATRKIGAARAAYGASGVTLEGSPLDVLASSAAEAELDRRNILYKGDLRAMGYADTAMLENKNADSAMTRGVMGAASSVLTGMSKSSAMSPVSSQTGYTAGDYGSPLLGQF